MYLFTRRWLGNFTRMLMRSVHTWLVTVNNRFFFRVHAGLEAGYPRRLRRQFGQGWAGRRLLVVCDFMALPISYDILVFLFIADNRRRRLGLDKLDVAFVSQDGDPGVREPKDMPSELLENARDYIHNLGQEATRLLDSVGSVLQFDNRRQFYDFYYATRDRYAVFPDYWRPEKPTLTPKDRPAHFSYRFLTEEADPDEALRLRPSAQQTGLARDWLLQNAYPRIPVTITLRQYFVQTRKNSDLAEWQRLVDHYRDSDLCFVVLPDFHAVYGPEALRGQNVVTWTDPVLSLSLRAALYRESALNLFVNNGPAALCWLTRDVPYIIFKILSDDRGTTVEALKRICDMEPGDQFWGATDVQRLVWDDDRFEIMMPEVEAMLTMLKDKGRLRPEFYSGADLNQGAPGRQGAPE